MSHRCKLIDFIILWSRLTLNDQPPQGILTMSLSNALCISMFFRSCRNVSSPDVLMRASHLPAPYSVVAVVQLPSHIVAAAPPSVFRSRRPPFHVVAHPASLLHDVL